MVGARGPGPRLMDTQSGSQKRWPGPIHATRTLGNNYSPQDGRLGSWCFGLADASVLYSLFHLSFGWKMEV